MASIITAAHAFSLKSTGFTCFKHCAIILEEPEEGRCPWCLTRRNNGKRENEALRKSALTPIAPNPRSKPLRISVDNLVLLLKLPLIGKLNQTSLMAAANAVPYCQQEKQPVTLLVVIST
jgi:hypothetical protein